MTAPALAKRTSVGRRWIRPATDESPVFVDSNVFLYAIDEADPKKQQAARHWRSELWRSRRGRISFQVLGEFYVNAVRKQPAAREEARSEGRDLLAWKPVVADAALLERGWKIQDRYRLSYWDSLISAPPNAPSSPSLPNQD